MFRSTFKRGRATSESRPPVWQPSPRPENPDAPLSKPTDELAPARPQEAEDRKDMQQRDVTYPTRDPHMSSGDLNALLGRGSEFEGKLAFEGKVRIDGTFTGEISTNDTLHIGEGAKVSAEISCGTVIVEGEVTGNIKAASAVELHRPAKVRGDITTPSLMVEKGVIFEGRSKMDSLEASNVVTLRAAGDED